MKQIKLLLITAFLLSTIFLNAIIVKAAEIGTTLNNPVNVELGSNYTKSWNKNTDHLFCYNKITLNDKGILKMTFSKPWDDEGEYGELEIVISDSNGESIWETDSYKDVSSAKSDYVYYIGLDSGVYYVNIKPGFYVKSGTITTDYSFNLEKNNYIEIEPNDGMKNATVMEKNKMYTGYIGYGDYEDVDFYKFYATSGTTYRVALDNYGKINNTSIITDVFDPNGKELIDNYDAIDENGYQYYQFVAQETGNYYVKFYNYSGSQINYKVGFYSVGGNIKDAKIKGIETKKFTGKNIEQSISVILDGRTLKSGVDYEVTYKNNKNIGTATVNIKGIGQYTGSVSKKFSIVLQTPDKLNYDSSKNDSIKVKWSKVKKATGYKIYYSTSKNGKYTLLKTIKNNSETSYKATKLSSGTTYYFKVRAYYNQSNGTKYSSYSNILTASTKPKTPSISKISSNSKKVKLTWKKDNKVTGYKIYYSTKKNGKYTLLKTINNKTTTTYKTKELKKNKTYYFKIMSYKQIDNVMYKSNQSEAKNIKVK